LELEIRLLQKSTVEIIELIKKEVKKFEAPVGFEPTNKGFADLPLKPLGYSAKLKK
jgi:hypothetical protein